MTPLLDRVVRAFVVEADAPPRPRRSVAIAPRVVAAPASVAVLAPPRHARAAGGAVALGLGRTAVLGVLGDVPPAVSALASPGAARVARRLAQRGHAVHATGRLAVVELGDAAEGARVAAAVAVPTALVVAVQRDPSVDALLRGQDEIVVCGADDAPLTKLALAGVEALGVPARPLAPPAGVARALAAAGVRA